MAGYRRDGGVRGIDIQYQIEAGTGMKGGREIGNGCMVTILIALSLTVTAKHHILYTWTPAVTVFFPLRLVPYVVDERWEEGREPGRWLFYDVWQHLARAVTDATIDGPVGHLPIIDRQPAISIHRPPTIYCLVSTLHCWVTPERWQQVSCRETYAVRARLARAACMWERIAVG